MLLMLLDNCVYIIHLKFVLMHGSGLILCERVKGKLIKASSIVLVDRVSGFVVAYVGCVVVVRCA